MELEIDDEAGRGWTTAARAAASAAALVAPELANARLAASILVTGDGKVRALNRDWRGKDRVTNVLSFPMLAREELLALTPDGPPVLLGDIALAVETCACEAAERGIAAADHVAHLVVHGFLHLAGYDHADDASADAMEALEKRALASMGINDPYRNEAG